MEAITLKRSWGRTGALALVEPLESRLALSLAGGVTPVVHLHTQLNLFMDNVPVPVPANLGVSANNVAPVHTHDTTGKLHVEGTVDRDYKLQELFDVWGKSITPSRFLDTNVDRAHVVVMTVNGQVSDAFGNLVLRDNDTINFRLERRPSVDPGFVAVQIAHSPEAYQGTIQRLYESYLRRTVDPDGLAYWSEQIRQNTTTQEIEALLLSSPEYTAAHGDPGMNWLQSVYNDVLGRTLDPEGQDYWISQLVAGATPASIVQGIASSAERWGHLVDGLYSAELERTPGDSERDYWVAQGLAGMRLEDMQMNFVLSPEYFNSPLRGNGQLPTYVQNLYQSLLGRSAGTPETDYWLGLLIPSTNPLPDGKPTTPDTMPAKPV